MSPSFPGTPGTPDSPSSPCGMKQTSVSPRCASAHHPSATPALTGSPFLPGSPERPGSPGSPYSRQERGRAGVSPRPRGSPRAGDPHRGPCDASVGLRSGLSHPQWLRDGRRGSAAWAPAHLLALVPVEAAGAFHAAVTLWGRGESEPCPACTGAGRRAAGTTHLGATHAQVPHVSFLSPGSSDAIPARLALREAHSVMGTHPAPSQRGGSTETCLLTGSPGSPGTPTSPWRRRRQGSGQGTVTPAPPAPPVGAQPLTFCPPGPRAPGKPVEPFSPCSPLAPCKQKRGARGRPLLCVPQPSSPPSPSPIPSLRACPARPCPPCPLLSPSGHALPAEGEAEGWGQGDARWDGGSQLPRAGPWGQRAPRQRGAPHLLPAPPCCPAPRRAPPPRRYRPVRDLG